MKIFVLNEENHGVLGVFSTLEKAVAYAKAWSRETKCTIWGNPETDNEIEISAGAFFIARVQELDPVAPE